MGARHSVVVENVVGYLSEGLEDLGLIVWNGLNKGIQWRLTRKSPGAMP